MTPFDPIPITVLTGFLGAGKTTLLNRLLKDPALADTAVIINEFGEVAIDHLLVEQASDGVIQLADGCLCCTVRGELVDTLADLIDRLQTGKIARLKRVIVETTGLADPVPVLQSIMAHPVLLQAYRLDGVVTLVDAVNGAASLDAHPEAVRQVAVADRLVLTKEGLLQAPLSVSASPIHLSPASQGRGTQAGEPSLLQDPDSSPLSQDLGSSPLRSGGEVDRRSRDGEGDCEGSSTPKGDIPSLKNRLHRLNPGAQIISVADPDIARLVTSCGVYDPETKTADVRRWLGETHAHDHHDHDDHHHDHHHHDHRHDSRVSSISLTSDKPIPYAALETFLDLLRSVHGDRLLRLKGIVELAEQSQRPLVVHAVQKVFHPPARLPSWPDDRRGVRLVLIGFDLAEDHVRRLFAAITDQPAIDQRDRAALEANPLAIPGM